MALFSPAAQMIITASADFLSTTASTAVPISTADLSIVLTTHGGPIQIYFGGIVSGARVQMGLNVDGTGWASPFVSGLVRNHATATHLSLSYHVWVTGLSAGTHTFQPTWWSEGNMIHLAWSGNPAMFWAQEG
jgi:hypothetical protein